MLRRALILALACLATLGAEPSEPAAPQSDGPFQIVKSLPVSEPTWGGRWKGLYLIAAERSILVYQKTGTRPEDYTLVNTLYPGHDTDIANAQIDGDMLYCGAKTEGALAYRLDELGRKGVQPAFQYKPEGRTVGWVVAHEGKVYAALGGGGMAVLNARDLTPIGTGLDNTRLMDFAVVDSGIVYARSDARAGALTIVDARDPQTMKAAGEVKSTTYTVEISDRPIVVGKKLLTSEFNGGMGVYDISDPLAPKLAQRCREGGPAPEGGSRAQRAQYATVKLMGAKGDIVVLTRGQEVEVCRLTEEGLEKIGNVYSAVKKGGGGLMSPTRLWLEDGILSIPTTVEGMRFYDLSSPAEPKLDLNVDLPSRMEGSAKLGRMLYVTSDVDGVWQLDWEAEPFPAMNRRIPLKGLSEDLILYKNHLYVANGVGLATIDVSDEKNPHLVNYWDFPYEGEPSVGKGWVEGVDRFGETLYVGMGPVGVTVFDLKDPARPKFVTTFKPEAPANHKRPNPPHVFAHDVTPSPDGRMLAFGGHQVCALIDVSNPAAPKTISCFETKLECSDAKFSEDGKHLITCEKGRIGIYDISRPEAPAFLKEFPCGGSESVLIYRGYMLVAGRGNGVDVFKIGKNVADLTHVQNIPSYFYNSKFFVEGERIFTNCQGMHELRLVE